PTSLRHRAPWRTSCHERSTVSPPRGPAPHRSRGRRRRPAFPFASILQRQCDRIDDPRGAEAATNLRRTRRSGSRRVRRLDRRGVRDDASVPRSLPRDGGRGRSPVIRRLTPGWRFRATLAALVLPPLVYVLPLDRIVRWISRGPVRSSADEGVDDRAL